MVAGLEKTRDGDDDDLMPLAENVVDFGSGGARVDE